MSRKIQGRSLFSKKKSKGRSLKYWLSLFVLALSLFYAGIFLIPVVPSQSNIDNPSIYKAKINPRSSLSSIAEQLSKQGLSVNPFMIQVGARSLFVNSTLKPGTYLFPSGGSLGRVLLQIARGDRVRESITIIPGMTIWQLRKMVDVHPALIHQTKGMSSRALLQSLNLNYPNDEGIFLPDTYVFDPDESDINIYRRAAQGMQKQLNQVWDQKDVGLPLKTSYD